ncbi:multifunctional 2',3'-cyclic-nucleotide 2'-phosphodiesterase/5'-nucleotidase/3'-nucleotidase [Vallitalea longa]|uniref:Multifunctional 2',3'-cyclic-nucleotide 2'-phosphodiesterase/5'-nucleotidase/3'-nucleotidase n=1 Tax=Vallitalea longa TaxID=2936439 RepID=A0A9W5YBP4_9FIRM|nr:5'-nucleotidase C-terminal domain-containing protein [Vallitalea longa]GKX30164.1 multifunctional 2',3'-cyclic-nucleotide 2'-phosphodiesterase/5'-nucleotidase/3'-nucleotidase [Vallitalea longa]
MKSRVRKLLSMLLILTVIFNLNTLFMFASDDTEVSTPAATDTILPATQQIENVIDILTVNDFHGNVTESGKNIGMAKMVRYINDQKAKNPNTIVVSGGDNYQGTALSNLTYGAPVNEMFKGMGVIASAVGNHEFDWGANRIEQWGKDGNFTFLAANIYNKETNEPVEWAKPYLIHEVAGKKIAFIGLSTVETAYKTKVDNVAAIEFKPADEAAKIWVDYLKSGKAEEGTPDIIIALTHVPTWQDDYGENPELPITGEEIGTLCKVEGIDAVITGHSHKTVSGYINDKPVIQAYKYGRAVGKLSIGLNEDGSVKSITPSVNSVYKISSDLVEDPETKEIHDKYVADFAPIANEVVGQLNGRLSHDSGYKNVTPLGLWTADIMRKAANTEIGLTNGGGLRRSLEEGNITMGDLYEVIPFDNTLTTMEVTGQHLKELVNHGIEAADMGDGQFAGLKVIYNPKADYENRIVSFTLEDGTPVDMNKKYTLTTNDFVATGGDQYNFDGAENIVDTFVPIRDELAKAIKAEGTVTAPEVNVISQLSTYKIKVGDVLWKIAELYNTTYQELAKLNNLKNPHLIYSGKTLLVPAN